MITRSFQRWLSTKVWLTGIFTQDRTKTFSMRFQFKEPAMSEFKVGDWVKRTDKITESIYQISSIDKDLIKCNFIKNGENWRLHTTKGEIEHATPEEIAAGHRIDCKVEDV